MRTFRSDCGGGGDGQRVAVTHWHRHYPRVYEAGVKRYRGSDGAAKECARGGNDEGDGEAESAGEARGDGASASSAASKSASGAASAVLTSITTARDAVLRLVCAPRHVMHTYLARSAGRREASRRLSSAARVDATSSN
mmetsp:Transcript_40462/g.64914  ORF Transcript_40462/g.64914 Transcript_40462/m.64914 type:complete len:139 (+) Transcript_40462:228-644(+)